MTLDGKVQALLDKVAAQAKTTQSVSAQFRQSSRVKLFREELVSEGKFWFQRPQKLRWQYDKPDSSQLTVNRGLARLSMPGEPARQFDLEHDPAMKAIFSQLFLWLDADALAREHRDYLLALGPDAHTLLLTPQPGSAVAKIFSRVELHFDAKTWMMESLRIVELNGDEKEIRFFDFERNHLMPDSLFQ